MSTQTEHSLTPATQNALACVEKGQQLAGHFPSRQDMERARRIATDEVTTTQAEAEMQTALQDLVDSARRRDVV
ncbi:MAG: hypothetical protein FWD11_04855 [Micrococcales bacterium]|nr:hypothetical protein [Micrococcales bacterium]